MNYPSLAWATRGVLGRSIGLALGRRVVVLVAALAAVGAPSARAGSDPPQVDSALRERAVNAIRRVMEQEQKWVKVHAAEYLLALDYREGVKPVFLTELELHGAEPQYRIGIWRVLARAAANEKEQAVWVDKIRRVLFDPASPDRLHATETLAKLGYKLREFNGNLREEEVKSLEQAACRESTPRTPYAAWILLNAGCPNAVEAEARLAALLDSSDVEAAPGGGLRLPSSGIDFGGDPEAAGRRGRARARGFEGSPVPGCRGGGPCVAGPAAPRSRSS